ncbi:MAG: hypothetical protein SGI89_12765 [bacterium]|nr:hypothetical protein [bacterium]
MKYLIIIVSMFLILSAVTSGCKRDEITSPDTADSTDVKLSD